MGLNTDIFTADLMPDPGNKYVGTNVPYAGMSPEEQQYFQLQSQILTQQKDELAKSLAEQNLLKPELMGTARQNIAGSQQLTDSQQQRVMAAMRGEVNDPTLARTHAQQEQELRARLRAQLGEGYETSTPGIQALSDLRQRQGESVFKANQDIINSGTANYNTTFGDVMGANSALMGIPASTLPQINAGTTLGAAFSAPLQTLAGQQVATAQTAEKYFADKLDYHDKTKGKFLNMMGTMFGGGMGK